MSEIMILLYVLLQTVAIKNVNSRNKKTSQVTGFFIS